MIFIGIDPGKSGAVAVLDGDTERFGRSVFPTPTDGKEYNEAAMLALLEEYDMAKLCAIEKTQAMPGQGSTSMHSIGYGAGLWHMALTACRIPFQVVSPRVWQKVMHAGIGGDDLKAKSIIAAKRLFPLVSLKRTERSKIDDHNMAEALLLAEYARRVYKEAT